MITEAALANCSGLRLHAVGDDRLQADFSEGAKGYVIQRPVMARWFNGDAYC